MSRFLLDNETVIDRQTGLMWTKNAYLPGDMMTFEDSVDFCNTLNLAGYSDWQLPNKDQLVGLTTNPNGVLSSTPLNFTGVQSSAYWTITVASGDPDHRIIVYMVSGEVLHTSVTNSFYAWCMRN